PRARGVLARDRRRRVARPPGRAVPRRARDRRCLRARVRGARDRPRGPVRRRPRGDLAAPGAARARRAHGRRLAAVALRGRRYGARARGGAARAGALASGRAAEVDDGVSRQVSVADLARRVRESVPALGDVRLVCVDGPAGSGKTTLAGRLAEALDHAPVLHLDDLYEGWSGLDGDLAPRLRAQVLD